MYRKLVQEIYKDLNERLTKRHFLMQAKLTKKAVNSFLKGEQWKTNIQMILIEQGLTCKGVLSACLPAMKELSEQEPEEGWLPYIYSYLRKGLYPGSIERELELQYEKAVLFYLEVLRVFLHHEKKVRHFDPHLDFALLTKAERKASHVDEEYHRFMKCCEQFYIYETLRIGREITEFDLLGHVAGVHHIAMHVARQMKLAGVSIDLALVSGAAAGHDLGKYGCKKEEVRRIPYLHYYYTEQWFRRHDMPAIGHVSTNHSTWDLELENLPVESLVLIYADFRVKSSGRKDGKEQIVFYSLQESFHVILSKLDNVDKVKEDRYRRVYAKLADFENYMGSLGVNTDLSGQSITAKERKDPALLNVEETVEALKYLAIEHNISLMNRISDEVSFGTVLEAARSEKNWKNSRAYINIFQEYFTYMTQKQKILTLNFLYELLMHREGDIRRQAADLIGQIIVNFDEEYRKEIPRSESSNTAEVTSLELWHKYLHMIVFPDHKVTERHRRWIGYALKIAAGSVLDRCKDEERAGYLSVFIDFYRLTSVEDLTAFILIDTLLLVPLSELDQEQHHVLASFTEAMAKRDVLEIKAGLLRFLENAVRQMECRDPWNRIVKGVLGKINKKETISLRFLAHRIARRWQLSDEEYAHLREPITLDRKVMSEIFLENLKAATPWILKSINIELLLDRLEEGKSVHVLHVATHLSNLVKVSEQITVRHSAGEALLRIASLMTPDQRNEVAIELTKGLEIGEYEFSKYIPEYLGAFSLYLHPDELDEFVKDIQRLLINQNERVVCVTLDTLGVVLENYSAYKNRFPETEKVYEGRRKIIMGMILSGLANYRDSISQEAFLVIGQRIFASDDLSLGEKRVIFELLHKKLVTLISHKENNELAFFNNAASLNHIYRFISDYLFYSRAFDISEPERVAFFPGTFDPFSLSHKAIAQEIRDLGFTVYLALDEFSWSKKTQPRMIRRRIIEMSVANEENIYLFPDHIPINIANPSDLRQLRDLFPGKEIHMVAGSDVVKNASSYKAAPRPDSIHHLNHILFLRDSMDYGGPDGMEDHSEDSLLGQVLKLKLPIHLEDISSTRIRENIDLNRDISNLIDPVAQNFIYDNSLYLREPQYKKLVGMPTMEIEVIGKISQGVMEEVAEITKDMDGDFSAMFKTMRNKGSSAVIVRNLTDGGSLEGMTVFRHISTTELYSEFENTEVTNFVRENTSGKIVLITGIYSRQENHHRDLDQILLAQTLAHSLSQDYTYAVYHPALRRASRRVTDVLERQGFLKIQGSSPERPAYAVDMKFPVTLLKNIETAVKEPFNSEPKVLEVIDEAHRKLQTAMTRLYPGNLVLSFNATVMHHKLVDLITAANQVTREQLPVRKLGENMCVPFGKILRGSAVPNTVTKSLHTEKAFEPHIQDFTITEYPNYSPLINQIRTIKSFNREVILVDDLLHKGYRIRELDPLFKQEDLQIDRIIVGILSGRGKDIMTIQNRKVESVYFLPSLRSWFVESSIYPFIGGDKVQREGDVYGSLLNTINLILPYVTPGFLKDAPRAAVYDMSMTCLLNARDIMRQLEEEYQSRFERKLTLNRLSEVIISPSCPDKGSSLVYDYHMAASSYIENDIETLIRLKNFVS